MDTKIKISALCVALAFALGACAGKKGAGEATAPVVDRSASSGADTGGADRDQVVSRDADADGAGDVAGAPSARQIFFDFDQFTVKPEYQSVVQATADFLKSRPKVKIIVQGNTDERGTREYNLSLGQKRAESVRRALNVLGISDDRIETVSFGEEKPMSECPNESCWSQNRRADIVYVAG